MIDSSENWVLSEEQQSRLSISRYANFVYIESDVDRIKRLEKNKKRALTREKNSLISKKIYEDKIDFLERKVSILLMRERGDTFKKIGDNFGISLERVRQIVEKEKRSTLNRIK